MGNMNAPHCEPVLNLLPWRSPGEARTWLAREDRQLLSAIQSTAFNSSAPDVLDSIADHLGRYFHTHLAVVVAGAPLPGQTRVGATVRSVRADLQLWSAVHERGEYDPALGNEWSNRPVNTATLASRYPQRAPGWLAIWSHLDAVFQLRATLFQGNEFVGVLCIWRKAHAGGFGLADHARLAAALPALSAMLRAQHKMRKASAVSITTTLSAFDQPAFLVAAGTVAYVNPAAMACYPTLPDWLRFADGDPDVIGAVARVTRLSVDGKTFLLVIPRQAPPRANPLGALTPPLRQIADLLAEGWSDKEIAEMTGRPLATVRTYSTRVMARLGVQSRGQLARLVRKS